MIFENVELHNVVEAEKISGIPGVVLRRYPRALRHKLNTRGRFVSGLSAGCEVRLVTEAPYVRAIFFNLEGEGEVYVYSGDFLHGVHKIPPGGFRPIQIDWPAKFDGTKPEALKRNFSPRCWRFVANRGEVAFVGIETYGFDYRPPNAEEKPAKRWLAYGSPIPHSHCHPPRTV